MPRWLYETLCGLCFTFGIIVLTMTLAVLP